MLNSMFMQLTVELVFGFVGLLIAVKIIGKRQVQQVSPFDFVSAIVLGELLGNAIYVSETKIYHVFYAIGLWTALLYTIEKIAQKSRKLRRVIEGSPKLIIKKGLIDYQVLKKEKLDFGELMSLLRGREVFSVREVEYAIIEPNGIITVIKKDPFLQITKKDMGLPEQITDISLPLVIEGKIESYNLLAAGHDERWLYEEMAKQDVNIKEVLFAEWSKTEGLYIQKTE